MKHHLPFPKVRTALIFCSLIISTLTAHAALLIPLDSDLVWTQSGIVVHVTRADSGFGTGLILKNNAETTTHVGYTPFDEAGTQYDLVMLELPPGQAMDVDLTTSLTVPNITHLRMAGGWENVDTAAYYYRKDQPGSRAHLPLVSKGASLWRFYPGNWDFDFDGFGLVNFDGVPGTIQVRQRDFQGQILHEETIAEALPPMGKVTWLVGGPDGSAFEPRLDTWFEVSGDVNFGLTGLRGTLIEQANRPLWAGHTIPTDVLDVVIDVFEVDRTTIGPDDALTLKLRVAHYTMWDLNYFTQSQNPDHRLIIEHQTTEPDGTRVYLIRGFEADTLFEISALGNVSYPVETLNINFQQP